MIGFMPISNIFFAIIIFIIGGIFGKVSVFVLGKIKVFLILIWEKLNEKTQSKTRNIKNI